MKKRLSAEAKQFHQRNLSVRSREDTKLLLLFVVCRLTRLPFLPESLASPSCLSAPRLLASHPLALLLHIYNPPFARHAAFKKEVSTNCGSRHTKTALCGVQEELFSRKVRHVVKSFPFFFLSFFFFFPVVAIADL